MSARGHVAELGTPHPLARMLPALFQEDPVALALVSALDTVLAPVLNTLDSLDAYVDPALAPADFVEWLSAWVGMSFEEALPADRQRELVAEAVALYRRRGSAGGIRDLVALHTGARPADVEVRDSGGVAWSGVPGHTFAGGSVPSLTVRVRVPDPRAVDERRLRALVGAVRPAHVPFSVEVVPW